MTIDFRLGQDDINNSIDSNRKSERLSYMTYTVGYYIGEVLERLGQPAATFQEKLVTDKGGHAHQQK